MRFLCSTLVHDTFTHMGQPYFSACTYALLSSVHAHMVKTAGSLLFGDFFREHRNHSKVLPYLLVHVAMVTTCISVELQRYVHCGFCHTKRHLPFGKPGWVGC